MDPKATITDEWLDGEPVPGDKSTGKGKTFARHVLYADGTEEYTYYRYGENQPIKTDRTVNKDQQTKFEKSKPPNGVNERTVGDRRMGWNPDTGQYDKDLGPADTGKPPEERPNYQTGFYEKYNPQTKQWEQTPRPVTAGEKPSAAASGTIVDRGSAGTFIVKPDGSSVKIDIPPKGEPNKTVTIKGDDGATYEVKYDGEGNRLGTPTLLIAAAPDKPQVVTMPDGTKKQAIIKDGRIVFEPIPGGEVRTSDTSGLPDTKLQLGQISSELAAFQKALDADVVSGKIQKTDAVAIMTAKYKEAETKINEINSITGAQERIYSGDVTQRGQDSVLLGQRLNAATTGFGNALTSAGDLNKYVKPGSDAGAKALPALLAMQGLQQQFMGAGVDANPARVEPGPALRALAGLTIETSDGTRITLPTGGGSAPRTGTMSGGSGNGNSQFTSGAGADATSGGQGTYADYKMGVDQPTAMSGVQNAMAMNPPNPFAATNMKLKGMGFPDDVLNEATNRFLQSSGGLAA